MDIMTWGYNRGIQYTVILSIHFSFQILGLKRGRKANGDAGQKLNVPTPGEQDCNNEEIVDLDDIYSQTVINDFETQQFDEVSREVSHDPNDDSEVTEPTRGPTTSRTVQ